MRGLTLLVIAASLVATTPAAGQPGGPGMAHVSSGPDARELARERIGNGKKLVALGVVLSMLGGVTMYYSLTACERYDDREDADGCLAQEIFGSLFIATPLLAGGVASAGGGGYLWWSGERALSRQRAPVNVALIPVSGGATLVTGMRF